MAVSTIHPENPSNPSGGNPALAPTALIGFTQLSVLLPFFFFTNILQFFGNESVFLHDLLLPFIPLALCRHYLLAFAVPHSLMHFQLLQNAKSLKSNFLVI